MAEKAEKSVAKDDDNKVFDMHSDNMERIFSRLPVTSLSRFVAVSKYWECIINDSKFIEDYFCTANTFFLMRIQNSISYENVFSIYSPPNGTSHELINPFPQVSKHISIAGPCKGIFVLSCAPWGDFLTLWNPCTQSSMLVEPPKTQRQKETYLISIALAFSSDEDRFYVVRLSCFTTSRPQFEILLMEEGNSEWITCKSAHQFTINNRFSCNIIFQGHPYWLGQVTSNGKVKEALIQFHLTDRDVRSYPLPTDITEGNRYIVGSLNDRIGMLTWNENGNINFSMWAMNGESHWCKEWTGPPLNHINRFLGFLGNSIIAEIVTENRKLEVIMVNGLTGEIKVIMKPKCAREGSVEVFECKQSLFAIPGMKTVEKQVKLDDEMMRKYMQ